MTQQPEQPQALRPAQALRQTRAYQVPKRATPTTLRLDGNEGLAPDQTLLHALAALPPEALRQYPDASALERALAQRHGVEPDRVLVTAGADDALYRLCQAMLEPGRRLLIASPTFEMIPRYAALTGAQIDAVEWLDGQPLPLEAMKAALSPQTALIALVSPNNPTGQIIAASELDALAQAAPQALLVVDHAYVEFAQPEHDLTERALRWPHVAVTRTFSKAWGLAGLRVGYALASPQVIAWLRAAGNPYAVAGPSSALALHRLERGAQAMQGFVALARAERAQLDEALSALGAQVTPSQANFSFARHPQAVFLRDLLAAQGIAARAYPDKPALADALRVSCPGSAAAMAWVLGALRAAKPDALLFDMDGVMVDVSGSYREAIIQTAARFGVHVTGQDIAQIKRRGDANNDWIVTQRLMAAAGVERPLSQVTEVFEALYQGSAQAPGLWAKERLLTDRALLLALRERGPKLAVVTGRPRADATHLLQREGLADLFEVVVCMEDGPPKPDPAPVALAMAKLGAQTAWMIGDTPDDMRAARAASAPHGPYHVAPLGVLAPQEREDHDELERAQAALELAGAGRVLRSCHELLQVMLT